MIEVRHVSKSFEGNPALKDVSAAATAGRVLAVCGENGAGKTTLMKVLSGAIRPDAGEIRLDGAAITIADPQHAIRLGIRTVHQELSLLPHISVAENILLGRMPHRGAAWLLDWPQTYALAAAALADLGFTGIDVRAAVADLGISAQQIVEIAKALVERPSVLILDEPTAVLSARDTKKLFAKMRELAAAGSTILYISHRLEEIFEISDDVLVLKDGVNVLAGETRRIDRQALIRAMVGRSLSAIYPARRNAPGAAALECRGLSRGPAFHDVTFSVRAGEVVGMFGLVGSGRSEVAKAIFGAAPAHSGEIRIAGEAMSIATPSDAIDAGLAFVTEDRKRDGLALALSVLDNGGLASMDLVSRGGVLDPARRRAMVAAKLDELAVRPRGLDRPVRQLSGGNQQKVVLAKWLLRSGLRAIILDEPTRGVDIATKVEIYAMVARLAEAGLAILLISSDMPEVLGMSDRVLIMRAGRIVAALERADATMEELFAHAAGVESGRMTA
jgi:ABC-type sugar transport system ATPase subunit